MAHNIEWHDFVGSVLDCSKGCLPALSPVVEDLAIGWMSAHGSCMARSCGYRSPRNKLLIRSRPNCTDGHLIHQSQSSRWLIGYVKWNTNLRKSDILEKAVVTLVNWRHPILTSSLAITEIVFDLWFPSPASQAGFNVACWRGSFLSRSLRPCDHPLFGRSFPVLDQGQGCCAQKKYGTNLHTRHYRQEI